MKKSKQLITRLICLVTVLTLMLCALPMQASAATAKQCVTLAGVKDSSGEVVDAYPAIPVNSGGTIIILTDPDLYLGSNYTYVVLAGEQLLEMDYVGDLSGISFYGCDDMANNLCYTEGTPVVGSHVTLVGLDSDAEPEYHGLTITGYDPTPNSDDLYELEVSLDNPEASTDIVLPAALVDEDGRLIGMLSNGDVFAFTKPTGSSAPKNEDEKEEDVDPTRPQRGESDPEETEAPDEPDVPETEETRDDSEHAYNCTDDDCDGECLDDVVHHYECEDDDCNGSCMEDFEHSDNCEDEDECNGSCGDKDIWDYINEYKTYLIIGACVLLVIVIGAIVFIVIRGKSRGSRNHGYDNNGGYSNNGGYHNNGGNGGYSNNGGNGFGPDEISQTRPVDPRNHGNPGDGWEDDPTAQNSSVTVCVEAMGRMYPIGQGGVTLGRAENATIRFPADTKGVSRQHCTILWHNGALVLVDLGSTSGTFLSSRGQIPANTPVPVSQGDVIYLGSKQVSVTIKMK